MTRKRTALAGAVLLSLVLLTPPPSHARQKYPSELVADLIETVVARWGALWHRERLPVRKQCEHGTSIDPNGCPVAASPPSGTASSEAGTSSDPDGSASTTEHGPGTDPNG